MPESEKQRVPFRPFRLLGEVAAVVGSLVGVVVIGAAGVWAVERVFEVLF